MSLLISVHHKFGDFILDAKFEAPKGLTVLYGRSGSGKSTIINAVAGLLRPQKAQITVGSQVLQDSDARTWVPPHKRRLGYIFQDSRLFPHLSVAGNLDYAARASRRSIDTAHRAQVIDMLDIGALLARRPIALSGGEKQRVAIGRALLADPQVILADEPLASLDGARKAEILPYFERIRDETDIPILYVTHAVNEVARLATTVIALEKGKVLRQGPARDVLSDPRARPMGLGAVGAVLDAVIKAHHDDGLTELDAGGAAFFLPHVAQPIGAKVRVRLPASDVLLAHQRPSGLSALNIVSGQVEAIQNTSESGAIVTLSTCAGPILARITQRSVRAMDLRVGNPCCAIVKTVAIASDLGTDLA
ncbi:molybdenum ABC transporter ATP-binding protein [Pacificibacter marinus]|uniref:Sulfate/thiosulfate import ATP-binding protein CysA n=1 Tax=Pacificibacter marinus TaxID=658057 RepID=A0A1Y5TLT0_9RHOB|nr:molybdenum ABC transporter ATP-binding protein [Pacificibacter marinus]SEL17126.1 molybdate transport system ATP-binding protein [Pacificibacter marinus]SLN63208.1 Sulfate/thiosulfate import ATP-binding protein CysA [Pacificibacter marinus]